MGRGDKETVNEELRHRFKYHPPPNDRVKIVHENIRFNIGNLAVYLDHLLPDGREKSLVMTKLEEAMFWANSSVARNHDDFPEREADISG